ncbi:MAG TPA: hypothetical protein VFQ65_17250, partial [Kofleriaceae bacterium]|nr:hypothetical protein [Kofleriaceae bacterium]
LAVWDSTHLAMRHDLDLREPLVLPLIDLDREATLITSTLDYDPLPPEMTLFGQAGIRTVNGLAFAWDTPAGSPHVVPYGVLEDGDVEWVSIEGQTPVTFQRFTGELGPAFPDHVTFLPPITGPALVGSAVIWHPFVDQFTAELLACSDDRPGASGTYRYDVMQTASWAMTHGNGRIELDLDAPGLPGFAQQIGDCTLEVERRFPGNQVAASGVRSL